MTGDAKKTLEFWFDFSCPYAYLASEVVEALAERVGAELQLRPFLLGGVFRAVKTPQVLFQTLSPTKARHNGRDMMRWAQHLGVELKMPPGHPFRTVTALRTLLATGEPYNDENSPEDAFEKQAIKALKGGKDWYEKIVREDGKRFLRVATPIPVVMERCVTCHDNYEGVKAGLPIGALGYKVPIE